MDPGEGPGGPGAPPPPVFLNETEAERVDEFFFETGPSPALSWGLDDRPPISPLS